MLSALLSNSLHEIYVDFYVAIDPNGKEYPYAFLKEAFQHPNAISVKWIINGYDIRFKLFKSLEDARYWRNSLNKRTLFSSKNKQIDDWIYLNSTLLDGTTIDVDQLMKEINSEPFQPDPVFLDR